ncbi:hypothetical protein [Pseudoalteromonas phage J2-1_QLiu-2017]|nr:hypothetical protein [Pseudoalteromonas phage J2-1_QLiu-2017]
MKVHNNLRNFKELDAKGVGNILKTQPTGGIPVKDIAIVTVIPSDNGGYAGLGAEEHGVVGNTIKAIRLRSTVAFNTLYLLDIQCDHELYGNIPYLAFMDYEVAEVEVHTTFNESEEAYINEQHKDCASPYEGL